MNLLAFNSWLDTGAPLSVSLCDRHTLLCMDERLELQDDSHKLIL